VEIGLRRHEPLLHLRRGLRDVEGRAVPWLTTKLRQATQMLEEPIPGQVTPGSWCSSADNPEVMKTGGCPPSCSTVTPPRRAPVSEQAPVHHTLQHSVQVQTLGDPDAGLTQVGEAITAADDPDPRPVSLRASRPHIAHGVTLPLEIALSPATAYNQ